MQVTYFAISLREPSPRMGSKSALPWVGFSFCLLTLCVSPFATKDSAKPTGQPCMP